MPQSVSASSDIVFIDPTKNSGITQSENHTYLNTSITGTGDLTALIDWNHSLVGWWRFSSDGDYDDYSTYGNNAFQPSSGKMPAYTPAGRFGGALQFDGTDDYLDCGNDESFGIKDEITMTAWIKPSELDESYIMGKYNSDNVLTGYNLLFTSSRFYFRLGSGSMHELYGSHSMSVGQWTFVAATYDGSRLRLYENGNLLKESSEDIFTITPNANNITLGCRTGYSYYFKGIMDDVRLFSRALTADEIRSSYDAGLYRLENNFTDLADGIYEYTAYAEDSAGDLAATDTRTIKIDSSYVDTPTEIEFIPPTEDDGHTLLVNHTYINTSISGTGDMTSFIDWNYSLVGWWRFEGNYLDDSSYSNNAVQPTTSMQPLSVTGKFGSAIRFDGINDYLDLSSHSSDSEFNTPTGSIELWFNPASDNKYSQLFNFRKKEVETFMIMREFRESNVIFIGEIDDVTQFNLGTPAGSIHADNWNHLVFQQTGSGFEVYINSVLQTLSGSGMGSTMWLKDTFPADADITIGHKGSWYDSGTACYYDGSIDEFRIWSRPLTISEINASYNSALYRLENNFTDLADGTYEYTAYVQDSSGNIDYTETRNITIGSLPPSPPPVPTYTVNGTVYNNSGGILGGAVVNMPSVGIMTTGTNGFYEFTGFIEDNYNFIVDMGGYDQNITPDIYINHNLTYDIILEASSMSFIGFVRDADFLPLSGAHVVAVNGAETYDTTTNFLGEYTLFVDNDLSKQYDLSASMLTYITSTHSGLTASTSGETVNFILGQSISSSFSPVAVVRINPANSGVIPAYRLGTTNQLPVLLKNPTDNYIVVPLHVGSTDNSFRYLLRLKTGDYRHNDVNITLAPHEERYVMIELIAGRKGIFNVTIGPDDNVQNRYDSVQVKVLGDTGSIFSDSPGLGTSSVIAVLLIALILIAFLSGRTISQKSRGIR